MQYWLFKSEPGSYSIDDLARDETTHWDGVRNYQARNMLRDDVREGDIVLFYHSSCAEPSVVGSAVVTRSGYPDDTVWDTSSEHPDAKSTPDKPIWFMVDIQFTSKFIHEVSLKQMRTEPELADMRLLQKGNRLSLFPISQKHATLIMRLSSEK